MLFAAVCNTQGTLRFASKGGKELGEEVNYHMSTEQIIKMWKDPVLRRSLPEEELTDIPENPAGLLAKELNESELALSAGGHYCGSGWVPSYTAECTCASGITVCNWSRCTHRTHRGCT